MVVIERRVREMERQFVGQAMTRATIIGMESVLTQQTDPLSDTRVS